MLRANDYLKCGGRKQLFEWWIRSCPLNFAIISGFFFQNIRSCKSKYPKLVYEMMIDMNK